MRTVTSDLIVSGQIRECLSEYVCATVSVLHGDFFLSVFLRNILGDYIGESGLMFERMGQLKEQNNQRNN